MAVHGAIGAWLLLLYSCSFGVYCMLPCALKLLYLCLESIILKEIPVFLLPFNGCFAVKACYPVSRFSFSACSGRQILGVNLQIIEQDVLPVIKATVSEHSSYFYASALLIHGAGGMFSTYPSVCVCVAACVWVCWWRHTLTGLLSTSSFYFVIYCIS